MANKAGRVLLIPRGEFHANTEYHMLDFVHYNRNSYVAKKTTTGNLPTNTEYFQPMTDIELNYVTPEMFGAVGDGVTDDTQAIIDALTASDNVIGDTNKQYHITSTINVSDKFIQDLNIKVDAFDTRTTASGYDNFEALVFTGTNRVENVSVTSEFEYTPGIDIKANPNTQTTGIASNVVAFSISSGETDFYNCKTNFCWAFATGGSCNVRVYNTDCKNSEMNFYNHSTGEIKVYNSNFHINKLVDSIYYHHIYTIQFTNMKFYNCTFTESGTGKIGNHYHGYAPNFDPSIHQLGTLELNDCNLVTSDNCGQLNAVNLFINGGSIEGKRILGVGNTIASAYLKNVAIKIINSSADIIMSYNKTTLDNCVIDILNTGVTAMCNVAYKLINSVINVLSGTLSFEVKSAATDNVIDDEVVISNNVINAKTISWVYPLNCSDIKITNNTYDLATEKTNSNPTDRGGIGYLYNCVFNNWSTPLNANSSNALKYYYIANGVIKKNIS
jgi:hypothetical protein